MRVRKDFTRLEGDKSARLVVIAAEGFETENLYFEAMKAELKAANVHVEVLHREKDGESSPEHVLEQIKGFIQEYNIEEDDELWIVVDRDKWTNKMLSGVARHCSQNKTLRFCVSNPCFELWLLLHLDDVTVYSEEDKKQLSANRKSTRHKTWLKHKLSEIMGGYNEADYDANRLLPDIETAITRAVALDIKPEDRWPQIVGTRVYRLALSIMGRNE